MIHPSIDPDCARKRPNQLITPVPDFSTAIAVEDHIELKRLVGRSFRKAELVRPKREIDRTNPMMLFVEIKYMCRATAEHNVIIVDDEPVVGAIEHGIVTQPDDRECA